MSGDPIVHGELAASRPGGPRNERRKAQTRAALLGAARHLFAVRGFEATTIGEITELADTAVGSFYNHFRTKEDVLAALLEDALVEQLRVLRARQASASDPAERVSIAHRHLLRATRTDPDWGWLLVRLEVPHRAIDSVLGRPAREDLRAGVEAGLFRVSDPEVAIQASGGALIGVMHAALRGELAGEVESAHAEGVLRSLGVSADAAAEIARRPLPEARALGEPAAGAEAAG